MSAETTADQPRWPIPPEGGYTSEDLFTLPDLPPHTELIDGSLVFMAPQRVSHGRLVDVVTQRMRAAQPAVFRVVREMAVVFSDSTTLEPDVLVVRADSVRGPDQTRFAPTDVALVIEVVAPSTMERDHDTKPHKYARAGIERFWRIEREGDDRIVASTFTLDDDHDRYAPTGTFINRLRSDQPFAVDIDLTEAERI